MDRGMDPTGGTDLSEEKNNVSPITEDLEVADAELSAAEKSLEDAKEGIEIAESEIEAARRELREANEEAGKQKELALYHMAELENFRKRALKEKDDLRKFGNEKLVVEFLPIIDNLELALKAAPEGDAVAEGVKMVLTQFQETLKKFYVEQVPALGEKFDPNLHEAMSQVEGSEGQEPQTITDVFQQGYSLNGRLIRPAKVVIVKGS